MRLQSKLERLNADYIIHTTLQCNEGFCAFVGAMAGKYVPRPQAARHACQLLCSRWHHLGPSSCTPSTHYDTPVQDVVWGSVLKPSKGKTKQHNLTANVAITPARHVHSTTTAVCHDLDGFDLWVAARVHQTLQYIAVAPGSCTADDAL